MSSLAMTWLQYELSGLVPLIAAYGLGGIAVVVLLAAAWFSPVFKQQFLWGAVVIAALMFVFSIGVIKGEKRVQAEWDSAKLISEGRAKKARADAERDVARKPSKWLPNHRDTYDRDGR